MIRTALSALLCLSARAGETKRSPSAAEIDAVIGLVAENNVALGGRCVSRRVALLEEAAAAAPHRESGDSCDEKFSLEKLLEQGDASARYGSTAMARCVCRSLVRSDTAPCEALRFLPATTTGRRDSRCRWFYRRGALLRALLTGAPEAQALCVESLDDPGTNREDVEMGCGLIVKHKDDVDSACRDFIAAQSAQEEVTQSLGPCQKDLRNTLGIGRGLTLLLDGEELPDYASLGAFYRKAVASGNPELCVDNHLCRALMTRDDGACEAYEKEIKRVSCPPPSAGDAAWRRRLDAQEKECSALATDGDKLLSKARAMLDAAGTGGGGEFVELENAYAVLSRSHERQVRRLASLKSP